MSPGQKDRFRLGGGMELKTSFGSFYPPNISPDRADGIGAWERGRILPTPSWRACRGRASILIRPFLALPIACRMSVDECPQPLRLPPHVAPGFRSCAGGCARFPIFDPTRRRIPENSSHMPSIEHPLALDPTDEEPRGRYLVQGPGHCAECHSPRDFGRDHRLAPADRRPAAGGQGQGFEPSRPRGLKDWSEDDIETALSTGFTPSGDVLGGPMAIEVGSLSKAPAGDLAAIAHYLKTYRAAPNP